MRKIVITKGLPASGKTTWAKKLVRETHGQYKRVCKKDLGEMLDVGFRSKVNEDFVSKVRDKIIVEALRSGKDVICDDTHLRSASEYQIRDLAAFFEDSTGTTVEVSVKYFDTPVEECIKRDLKREHSVGSRVIKSLHHKYINRGRVFQLEQDDSLPRAIICDLDGTLALLNRSPFDYSTIAGDDLNVAIHELLLNYEEREYDIFLISGRPERSREDTEKWLEQHDVPYTDLYLRGDDDTRRDTFVKAEIFDDKLRDKYFVEFVLDDRTQVVEMWRKLGLLCLQVAAGDF